MKDRKIRIETDEMKRKKIYESREIPTEPSKTFAAKWMTSIGLIVIKILGNRLIALDIYDPCTSSRTEMDQDILDLDKPECLPSSGSRNDIAAFAATEIAVKTRTWLAAYLKGENPPLDEIEISLVGTPFQKNVWKELRAIPYGQSVTYGELAVRIAGRMGREKMSAQAIGGAVGKNPVSILIPCHRVLGAGTKLTGYGGGLPLKAKLLEIEGIPYRW